MKVLLLALVYVVFVQFVFAADDDINDRQRRTNSREASRIVREVNAYTHLETSSVEEDVHEVGKAIRADSLANHLETRRVCQTEDHFVQRQQEEEHNTTRTLIQRYGEGESTRLEALYANVSRLILPVSSQLSQVRESLSRFRQSVLGQHNQTRETHTNRVNG